MASKYGKKTQKKMEKVMHEYKEGDLKTSHGRKVTDRDQAIAIGLSEAREAGDKVPSKSKSKSSTSSTHKKASSHKGNSHKSSTKSRQKDTVTGKTEKMVKNAAQDVAEFTGNMIHDAEKAAKKAMKTVKKTVNKAEKSVKKALK
jgi:hypothetical protein